MPQFLDQWFDASVPTDAPFDIPEFRAAHILVLEDAIIMASHALQIPRRLHDASPDELADDKKFSKTLRNRLSSSLRQWYPADEEVPLLDGPDSRTQEELEQIRANGAQIDWHAWFEEFAAEGRKALALLAAYVHAEQLPRKSGNRLGQRILNELNVVNAIYQDILASE